MESTPISANTPVSNLPGVVQVGLYSRVGQDWRSLGISLNIPGYTLDTINVDNRQTSDKARGLINKCCSSLGSSFTVGMLCNALNSISRADIVVWLRASVVENTGPRIPSATLETHKSYLDQTLKNFAGSALSAAVRNQTKVQTSTVLSFHTSTDDTFTHFRGNIYSRLNETGAWEKLLANRGLLGGEGVETMVAKLRGDFEAHRRGNPAETIIGDLCDDPEFREMSLLEWCDELTALKNAEVTTEVIKLKTWLEDKEKSLIKKSKTAFEAQSDLRSWLIKHEICETEDVDELITRVRKAGVTSINKLKGFDKDDLKDCGFNTVQAIATLKALSKE